VSARVALAAPAKLNLWLGVGARRPDGFHELDTVLLGLGWADSVVVERRPGGCTLALDGPAAAGVPGDASNLALRAAHEVLDLARVRGLAAGGVHIALTKHVPAQAGLGGGSSDAAAAARACAELVGLDPDDAELRARLAALGSDCAFFLEARASGIARCTGRGERVEPWPAVSWPFALLVVTPDLGCATGAVYAALARARSAGARTPTAGAATAGAPGRAKPPALSWPSDLDLDTLRARLGNDLEGAALLVEPRLAGFRACLEGLAPGVFHLAGSGSSWFGFFPDAGRARAVLTRLTESDEGRRYALRASWVGAACSRGLRRLD